MFTPKDPSRPAARPLQPFWKVMHNSFRGLANRVGLPPARKWRARLALIAGGALLALSPLAPAAHAASPARTWYVGASAPPGGDGSARAPFNSLAAVQLASGPGDTIIVLPSAPTVPPLDGGIALKPSQRLIGSGPSVAGPAPPANAPRITNTTPAHNSGDAVELAAGDTVSNLEIAGAYRGGIYGSNVTGVQVDGNNVSGANTSCTEGFFIAQFTFPTDAPGVGAPLPGGIKNGWAGIMIDASTATGTETIQRNYVHDAACSDGIDLRLNGTANLAANISHNSITRIGYSGLYKYQSVMSIGVQTNGASVLDANEDYNTETNIGGQNVDAEGVFGYPSDSSHMTVAVNHNTAAHVGSGLTPYARSANGMEFVILSGDPTASMSIANSSFSDTSGDILEELNLGVGSQMKLSLDNVTATDSTGLGDTGALPFNNGDCLLELDAGSGTTTTLAAAGSNLTNCANNGLTVYSNVVNGSGPAKYLSFGVNSSTITGNRSHNLRVENLTGLTSLAGTVQDTNLGGSSGTNAAFDQPSGTTTNAALDLGGGSLGSSGGNCIAGGAVADAETTGYNVFAEHNWWGAPTGPAPGSVVAVNGTIQTTPFLTRKPAACS